jgi:glycosyltransferase involved in cell wall biosynthesis
MMTLPLQFSEDQRIYFATRQLGTAAKDTRYVDNRLLEVCTMAVVDLCDLRRMQPKTKPRELAISVAMATFNGERFLREQLNSIAGQSLLPSELVVTDDSSSPDTLDIVRKFESQVAFPVRIHKNESRLGYRANFFKAFSLCTGDLIAPCDQDDVWMPNKLERLSSAFSDDDVLLAIHNVTLVDSNLKTIPRASKKHWYHEGTYGPLTTDPAYMAYGMSLMVRRDILNWIDPAEARSFEERAFGHDLWLWFVATSLGKIVGLSEELALYRQHAANVVGALKSESKKEEALVSRRTGSSHYIRSEAMSLELGGKLINIRPDAPEEIRRRAQEASDFYRKRAMFYRLRAALYGRTNRWQRIGTATRLLRSGCYRPIHRQGLGRKALLKDIAISLIKNEQVD